MGFQKKIIIKVKNWFSIFIFFSDIRWVKKYLKKKAKKNGF